jgi:pentatricopeptide repeat protein
VISWNALIAGYAEYGRGREALDCFEQLQCEGLCPDALTFTCILKACASAGQLHKGETVHMEIIRSGLITGNIFLGNALVDMYSRCGAHAKAQQVHDELGVRNSATWNALIAGYARDQRDREAMNCFEKMKGEGVAPDAITFSCMLKVCGNMGAVEKGEEIHDEIVHREMIKDSVSLGNALVDMYAKCGSLTKAQDVHNKLDVRDIISWNALIAGYVQHGQSHKALKCFAQMKDEGFSPDVITFTCILTACGAVQDIETGKEIHEEVVNRCMLRKDLVLGISLVDMYAKCGFLAKARKVHDELHTRNSVSWSALIAGYAQHGHGHEALNCLEHMQDDGISPNVIIFTCILKSCGNAGALDKGKQIHDEILSKGWLEKDVVLGNALVDMYVKCGALVKAQQLLDELHVRDVVSWNAVIGGYADRGYGREALDCFGRMESEGLIPDGVTFLCVLSACSHSGLLNEAEACFDNMTRRYGMTPTLEHFTCMIVIFGCVGMFEKAMLVIKKKVPSLKYPAIWVALLTGCQKWGNVNLARLAFDWAIELDNNCASAYVLMSNIYAAANMPEDAKKIENMRLKTNCFL